MQTFRSVGDTLALQTWSGENWCLGRESHRGNNVVHTQRHTPMTNAFLKTGFIFVEHFAVPASPGWMTSKPISPNVWFWTRHPLLAEPSSNPHSPLKSPPRHLACSIQLFWNLQHKPSTPWVLVRQALWKLPVMLMWRCTLTPFQRLWATVSVSLEHENSPYDIEQVRLLVRCFRKRIPWTLNLPGRKCQVSSSSSHPWRSPSWSFLSKKIQRKVGKWGLKVDSCKVLFAKL